MKSLIGMHLYRMNSVTVKLYHATLMLGIFMCSRAATSRGRLSCAKMIAKQQRHATPRPHHPGHYCKTWLTCIVDGSPP